MSYIVDRLIDVQAREHVWDRKTIHHVPVDSREADELVEEGWEAFAVCEISREPYPGKEPHIFFRWPKHEVCGITLSELHYQEAI